MKPRAILTRIVCSEVEHEHKSAGGILLPDSHTRDQVTMKVISRGSEVKEVLVGDTVLIAGHQGHDILVDGNKYVVFEESQVLAVVEYEDG